MKVSKVSRDREAIKTMKWITLQEAVIYARKSLNTVKKLINEGKIYGSKKGGEWIVDRASIDSYYNEDRDLMRIKLSERYS